MKSQDLTHLCESIEALKVEITNIDTKFNEFKSDIVETLRKNMEKCGEKIIMKSTEKPKHDIKEAFSTP